MKFKTPTLLLVLLAFPAVAQSSANILPDPAREAPYAFEASRSLKITCLAADTGIASLWLRSLQGGSGSEPAGITVASVSVPFSKRSQPIAYKGPEKIEFFDKEPPPGPPFSDKGERQGPAPVAIGSLAPGQREVLLLFIPLPPDLQKGNLKYRVISFDDSMDSLPWGGYRLVNFSTRPLIAFAGKREMRFDIEPNSTSGTIAPGGLKRNIPWMIFDPNMSTQKPVFSAQWLHRPDYRSLVFITDSQTQRGAVSVRSIDEWKR